MVVMDRRDALLRELNLHPVWKLRHMAAEPEQAVSDTAAVEVSAVTSEVLVDPVCDAPQSALPVAQVETVIAAGAPSLDCWTELQQQVQQCQHCQLCAARTQTVFGVGDTQANWLFVGEGPGENEDLQGEPFVGQAGRLLDNMLHALQLTRADNVYIANVVKCRPPGNRTPNAEEIAACMPYLQQQIALIRPKVIFALGRTAASALLMTDSTLASLRGRLHHYRDIPVVVSYHPAYLLRSPAAKAKAWQDLCMAVKQLES